MKQIFKDSGWRPLSYMFPAVAVCWLIVVAAAFSQDRNLPAGASAYTEIIEVGDAAPVIVPSLWNTATVMVRQIEGGNSAFRAAIGTSTVDARLPLIKNITASFKSSGFLALQSETGSATFVVYRVMQSERAIALDEGVFNIVLPSANVSADLATDSIGLIDAINSVKNSSASETSLLAAIDVVAAALSGVLSVDANIATDSVGLIAAINAAKAEVAQPTETQQQTVSLAANTAANVTSEIIGRRNDIVIRAQDPEIQFWISTEGPAVIGSAIPVRDWVRIRLPKDVVVSAISSEALNLSVSESGW